MDQQGIARLLRRTAAACLPPIAARLLRSCYQACRQRTFEYVAEGWRRPIGSGWGHAAVAAASAARWPGFENALRGPGPLGIAHEAPVHGCDNLPAHNTIMSFGYVLALAAQGAPRVSVLDWGGGLGHYGLLARALLPDTTVDYHCKDLPAFCARGRELLPDAQFFTSDADFAGKTFDLVVASGALQYCEPWREAVRSLSAAAGRYLFITRLPVARRATSFVFLQRPHEFGYPTEYLSWCFNRDEFLGELAAIDMELCREFVVGERLDVPGAPEPCLFAGFLFRHRKGVNR